MKNYFILPVLFLFFLQNLNAQVTGLPSGSSCATAPVVYPLDGYSNILPPLFPIINPLDDPTTFCGVTNNNQWIAFIAGSTSLEIEITVGNCTGSGQNTLQAQAYFECGAPWTTISNCLYSIYSNSSGIMNMTNLTIGETYYIMFDVGDGFEAYPCTYSISTLNGSTLPCSTSIIADAGEDLYLNCNNSSPDVLDGGNSTYGIGDSIVWYKEYDYAGVISTDIQFPPSSAGTYYLVIMDDSLSCIVMDEVEVIDFNEIIELENELDFSNSMDSVFYLDGINITSSDSNLVFSWSTLDGNIVSGADSIAPLVSSNGVYELTVTDTITGCVLTETVNVTITNIFSPTKNKIQIDVIPNVINNLLTVNLFLEKTSSIDISLFNAGGIAVQNFNFGKKPNGEHQLELRLQYLPTGVYFILVKTEEGSAVEKVVKQ